MIHIVGKELNQWDVGRFVGISDIDADCVYLSNRGDSRAVIMDIEDGQAKIPDYLLISGKQLQVSAVKNRITVEHETFFVHPQPRPENYIYEDDQRNYIYAVIEAVEETVARAERAAEVIESGKFEKTLYTRDVFVGGAKDAYGNWGPRNPNIVDHTPLAEPVKNEMFISTMKIPKAGQHFLILPEGSNYLYKMQITEADNIRVFDVDEAAATSSIDEEQPDETT